MVCYCFLPVQIDRLCAKHFNNVKVDEVLNFSVAVTVMRVQVSEG